MATTQVNVNKANQFSRGSIDTSSITTEAFKNIKDMHARTKDAQANDHVTEITAKINNPLLDGERTSQIKLHSVFDKTPNHAVKVKAVTNQDGKEHTYFHSLSIDAQVTDFLHTCELRCPFNWDLMEYWEPIRQSCAIYGTNQGDYKLLFVGRVRELIQDGYELSITFQNYGWKFKQDVSQSYAKDNVLNKNGYQIMLLMFAALKIDSYSISEAAKTRLKQVGMDEDGNLVVNGEEIEEMPDLLERLKESDPSKYVSKQTLNQKLLESQLFNIENINYTLKYEEKTPVMQKIDSQGGNGSFSAGKSIYGDRAWGSASGGGGGGSGGSSGGGGGSGSRNCNAPSRVCSNVQNNGMNAALQTVYLFQRDCTNNLPSSQIATYASQHPSFYNSQVKPCLNTMAKYTIRKDKRNGASEILGSANYRAGLSGASQYVQKQVNNAARTIGSVVTGAYNALVSGIQNVGKTIASWFGW